MTTTDRLTAAEALAREALTREAPRMRALLAEAAEWDAQMGGFDTQMWSEIRALLDRLRNAGA